MMTARSSYLLNLFKNKYLTAVKNIRHCSTQEVKVKEVKESILQNWGKYWKNLYQDYKDVAIDLKKDCKERPIRALFYFSLIGSGYYFYRVNPDEISFREALMENTSRLMFVAERMRNPVSAEHVLHMKQCLNEQIVRRLSLGVVSFIWLDNYSDLCKQYKVTCTYLKPSLVNFHHRIVDVGFLGKWWILENKMQDYDINNNEI
ncbi:mitochondrial import inner membrane translocase subunit Tim29 [Microplitis demolitor]|uniref:mitochondrial import inner membrane translocase subunit Tim29 n=1 Tax=Microplitis demolitor TaxID=69319 RepID=UPI0004CC9444|nr:mitochondrial import inner membrane translocase subunit Tim29 [Microplitis demolitor]